MLRLMLYKKLQYCLEEEIHGTIWTKQDKHVSHFKAFNRKSQINFFKQNVESAFWFTKTKFEKNTSI